MRAFVVVLLLASVSSAQDSRKNTQADFLIGQVNSSLGARHVIDLGYANGFTGPQQFALFRSERLAWVPVGIVSVTKANSTSSRVRSIKGMEPRLGDLVVSAYSTLGHISNTFRDDNYVRRRILSTQGLNQYDTGSIQAAARQLASQRKHALKWYKKGGASGLRIVYGTTSAAYKSQRVRNLASQCKMLAEFQQEGPASLDSLSKRWATVLPTITGYTPPPVKEKAADSEEADDEEFAVLVPNLFPAVDNEYASDPLAIRELYAVILAAAVATSPSSPSRFIRNQLKQSQFPYLADEADTIERLDSFLVTLSQQ